MPFIREFFEKKASQGVKGVEALKVSKTEYKVKRRLQEQSGSYYVALPKIWVEAKGLQESDLLSVIFNGIVKIEPIKKEVKPIEQ